MLKSTILFIVLLPICALGVAVWHLKARPLKLRLAAVSALAVYVLALLHVTLFPVPIQPELLENLRTTASPPNNLVPVTSTLDMVRRVGAGTAIRQIVGNVLLFVPLGYLVPTIWKIAGLARIARISLALSLLVETTQFGLSQLIGYTYRIFDVDDLILNLAGGIIGYGVYLLLRLAVRLSGLGEPESPSVLVEKSSAS